MSMCEIKEELKEELYENFGGTIEVQGYILKQGYREAAYTKPFGYTKTRSRQSMSRT